MVKSETGAVTRRQILEKAFALIHRKGFRATSISDIIDEMDLTKGAFYYHFKSKTDLGYSVIDEFLEPYIRETMLGRLKTCEDPIEELIKLADAANLTDEMLCYGCPANNLAIEMAPINPGFQKKLESLINNGLKTIADALDRGKENGYVAKAIDSRKSAMFIMAVLSGARGMAKAVNGSASVLSDCFETLHLYLKSLRPQTN